MHETMRLAEFVANATYENLPPDVIEKAKVCMLDHIGTSLWGSTTKWGRIITDFVDVNSAKPESTVYAHRQKTSASNAALANGTMAHGYELDDIHVRSLGHPGSITFPAALAVGERENVDGKTFLTAVVVGYELFGRVGMALGKAHMVRGYHTSNTSGPFGAAAAAGKILSLDANQIANAFGLAGSSAGGLMEFSVVPEETMVKRLHSGQGAENGVKAAMLAQMGFTAPHTILEGVFGVCRVLSDEPNIEKLTKDLGDDFQIRHIWFKPYSCCGALHSAIDAILELREKHIIDPKKVDGITIGMCRKAAEENSMCEPQSVMAAQYSIPYAAAATLLTDVLDPKTYSEAWRNPEIIALSRKVKVTPEADLEAVFPERIAARVAVKMKSGAEYATTVYDSKGTERNPLTYEELLTKFTKLTKRILPDAQLGEIVEAINKLETLSSIREFCNLLRP